MTIGKKAKVSLSQEFVVSPRRIRLTTGEILRILREKNGLTQNELAKKAGLTQATISSLEANRIKLGIERAKSLAKALSIHPAVLVFPDWDHSGKVT